MIVFMRGKFAGGSMWLPVPVLSMGTPYLIINYTVYFILETTTATPRIILVLYY